MRWHALVLSSSCHSSPSGKDSANAASASSPKMGWMHFSSPGVEWEREFESEFPASLKDGGDGSANGSKWGLARWSDARLNLT